MNLNLCFTLKITEPLDSDIYCIITSLPQCSDTFYAKRITNVINVIDVDGVFVLCRLCLDTGGGRVRPGELMSV